MAIEIYLGNPPAYITDWIRNHSLPAAHPETRFTIQGGTVETYNITGTLDLQWMIDNGFFNEDDYEWTKTITQVDIGNTVTSIGSQAFANCTNLMSIMIPNSVTNIENNAFYSCSNLTSVTIPNFVTSLGGSVFDSCSSLTTLTIPSSVTYIGLDAFFYCSSLTSITFLGKTLQQVLNIEDEYEIKNYPFGLNYANESGVTIYCTDGDILLPYEEE